MSDKKVKKKGGFKERLNKIRVRHQRILAAHEAKLKKTLKRRGWSRRNIILASCFTIITLLFIAAITWQSPQTQRPPLENAENVEQQPTNSIPSAVYIWPDGRVEPSTSPVVKVGEGYYMFVGNVSLPIIVLKDNIVIDGAGLYLLGEDVLGSRGMDISYRKNITIINLRIKGFDYGVYLHLTEGSTISNCEFAKNYCGVWVSNSSLNHITSNSFMENKGYAIWLKSSANNSVSSNRLIQHSNYTLYIGFSGNNTIKANIIENNRLGIFLFQSARNTIAMNNISKNFEGIHMLQSSYNLITLNDIIANDVGLGSSESFNNTICLNNFIDNVANVNVQNSTEKWDDGISMGNYWSDYRDKYPQAAEQREIWDMPYVIDERNEDKYPLIRKVNIKQAA